MIMGAWIQTDDMQYCRKLDEYRYELIEANSVDGQYIVSDPEVVDLREYFDENGAYTKECKSYIGSYYSSVGEFEGSYTNSEDRMQVLAEIIYEQTSVLNFDLPPLSEEDATAVMEQYMETGVLDTEQECSVLQNF